MRSETKMKKLLLLTLPYVLSTLPAYATERFVPTAEEQACIDEAAANPELRSLASFADSTAKAADSRNCVDETEEAAIYACLNEYAANRLAPGSAAEKLFAAELERSLGKYDLKRSQIKVKPLSEAFRIVVDQTPQGFRNNQGESCFAFKDMRDKPRKRAIIALQSQIEESAKFLAGLHASSWGHQVSMLFPIKEVSLCSREANGDRAVAFEQRSLLLGVGKEAIPAHELRNAWNSGNPIRSTELTWVNSIPYLGKMLRKIKQAKVNGDTEAVLRDKLADNWLVLNPNGALRTTAMYTLAEAVYKIRKEIGEEQEEQSSEKIFTRLKDAVAGPGFTEADRAKVESLRGREADLQGLYSLWQKKLYSPENILNVFENAIGDQAKHDANVHLTLRKLRGGVVVANDKNIVVRLEQLMANSIPVSQFEEKDANAPSVSVTRAQTTKQADGREETKSVTFKVDNVDARDLTVNADDAQGGVVIDLIDNVVVSVQMPKVSPAAYRRISLRQAMENFVPENGTGEIARP